MSNTLENLVSNFFDNSKETQENKKKTFIEWVEDNRVINDGNYKGRMIVGAVPPAIEIYNTFENDKVRQITIMACTQLLKTEFTLNVIAWAMVNEPSNIIYLLPTLEIITQRMQGRIQPMMRTLGVDAMNIEAPMTMTGKKQNKVIENKSMIRLSNGAFLVMQTPSQRASIGDLPAPLVIFDEYDAANQKNADESIAKMFSRTTTYKKSKIILVSSPIRKNESKIWGQFLNGSQSSYHGFCGSCNGFYAMESKNYFIPKDGEVWRTDESYLQCSCGNRIYEKDRLESIRKGKYIDAVENEYHKSYKISGLASPFLTLQKIAQENYSAFQEWQNTGSRKNLEMFYCERLAEPFSDELVGLNADDMAKDIFVFNSKVQDGKKEIMLPKEIMALSCAVDIQGDRIEYLVCGWGLHERGFLRCWNVIYGKVMGDDIIQKDREGRSYRVKKTSFDTFLKLYNLLYKDLIFMSENKIKGKNIPMSLGIGVVDAKYLTEIAKGAVAEFNKALNRFYGDPVRKKRWFAINGSHTKNRQGFWRWSDKELNSFDDNTNLIVLHNNNIKNYIFTSLQTDARVSLDDKMFVFGNKEMGFDKEFFNGLFSEKFNESKQLWEKINRSWANEAWDLLCYNFASIYIFSAKNDPDRDPLQHLTLIKNDLQKNID